MAFDNTTNTATTDHKPEHETDETPLPEESREPSAAPVDTDVPVAEDAHPGISDTEVDDNAAGTADGFAAGAAAIVSAGLALVSLSGTGIGDMLRARAEIVGQIEAGVGGGAVDQIDAFYGSPWHTAALVNGAVALVAVLIGGVLLAAHSNRLTSQTWVKAVALGGVVLGGIGVLVAVGMYLDLFAAPPVLPQTPPLGGG
jgi:hypothetical protein